MYVTEMKEIRETYEFLCKINPKYFKDFDISLSSIRKGLAEKLTGLKSLYWKELFDNLSKLTDRLTSISRKRLLERLRENMSVDFSADNAYAIVLWAIKNANQYFDEQLIEVFKGLVEQENILSYKSNHRFTNDDWRFRYDFIRKEKNYYLNDRLDYRIVCTGKGGIYTGNYQFESRNGLSEYAFAYIQDVLTVGKNLGFESDCSPMETEWEPGKKKIFYLLSGEEFMSATAYKNGNIHFKLHQDFLRKWNIEFGRLMGWINNKSQASEEMNIPMEFVEKFYGSNHKLELQSNLLLSV